jgi:glutamine amidotransferase
MQTLRSSGLDETLRELAASGTPLLGLCLGMQLLFDSSEEHGGSEGLGLIAGVVTRLDSRGLKLPHIGWNPVSWLRESPLRGNLSNPATFYHVHSYAVRCGDPDNAVGSSDYGSEFTSIVERGNVRGAQFHPEKSSANGLALLANFVALCSGLGEAPQTKHQPMKV